MGLILLGYIGFHIRKTNLLFVHTSKQAVTGVNHTEKYGIESSYFKEALKWLNAPLKKQLAIFAV